jgi:signal transduction histidine kinase
LLALINDVLDISKIEAGKMQLDRQLFTVATLVDEIRETIRPLADRNSNSLEFQVAENLAPLCTDYVRLKQCLLNLSSNACKFTRDGRIVFSVVQERRQGRDYTAFHVADTGVGLSEEQIARLFQPFTQADASTTRKFGGTGLGLAITKKLCEALGGEVSVTSQLGEGSTFTIRLPNGKEESAAAGGSKEATDDASAPLRPEPVCV